MEGGSQGDKDGEYYPSLAQSQSTHQGPLALMNNIFCFHQSLLNSETFSLLYHMTVFF